MLEKSKESDTIKTKISVVIRSFGSDKQFGEDYCQNSKAHYPFLQEIIFI
jgi:hypothetical protein